MEEILASIRRIISEDQEEDGEARGAAAVGDAESAIDDVDMAAPRERDEPRALTEGDSDGEDDFEAALVAEAESEHALEPDREEAVADQPEFGSIVEEVGHRLDAGGFEDEPGAFDDSILELTEVVDDGDADDPVDDLDEPAILDLEAAPAPVPEPRPPSDLDFGTLISGEAAAQASTAFAGLAEQLRQSRDVALGGGARTLEELVKELLRPMLKEWLDANLPPLVQRLVEREIAKLADRADQQ